jgi:tight adherence protein C
VTIVVAFFLPDFWLAHAINKRRDRIRLSLPDSLDLLSISMEAGLGLDQAVVRVGQELRVSHPDLSEELMQVNFEQRAGAPRLGAWQAMADRVNVENVRSFVAMLVQTDRFGTPISKSLATFSDALRTQRRQQAEEMAAKTTVKLVLPLVFLIFPDVFIVTVGPALIKVMRGMGDFLG